MFLKEGTLADENSNHHYQKLFRSNFISLLSFSRVEKISLYKIFAYKNWFIKNRCQ